MRILLDMGHCLSGSDTGAQGNGYTEEKCTREVGYKVKSKLESLGHTVIVCNCDSANSVRDSLNYRCNKANNSGGDIFISIHLNAGGGQGTEIYTYNARQLPEAQNILNNIVGLGFKNRGIKDGSGLAVINGTKMKSMLVEICFIDSSDMSKYNAENIANAIVKGLVGKTVTTNNTTNRSTSNSSKTSTNNSEWINLDGKVGYINTPSGVNVREGKSTSSKILGTLSNGSKVQLYRREGDWIHIYYKPHGGYIYSKYIKY